MHNMVRGLYQTDGGQNCSIPVRASHLRQSPRRSDRSILLKLGHVYKLMEGFDAENTSQVQSTPTKNHLGEHDLGVSQFSLHF